jgi:hypothetical protein
MVPLERSGGALCREIDMIRLRIELELDLRQAKYFVLWLCLLFSR